MKNNRILLSENEAVYNELIQFEKLKESNGRTLIALLDRMGLTFERVDNWEQVIEALTKDYPNAKLQFNLDAAGIADLYLEAEAFYQKNYSVLSFEPFTEEQAEAIREKQRHFAESPQQLEAHGLMQTVVDSLLRLSELGIKLNLDELYQVSYLFTGGNRHAPLQVNKREQLSVLNRLK